MLTSQAGKALLAPRLFVLILHSEIGRLVSYPDPLGSPSGIVYMTFLFAGKWFIQPACFQTVRASRRRGQEGDRGHPLWMEKCRRGGFSERKIKDMQIPAA